MASQRTALVTGGSRGIGRATCLELARAGWAVLINFCENLGAAEEVRQQIEEKFATPADICQADVTRSADRELMIEFALERFGRIDMLVNNAGAAPKTRTDVLNTDEESFDRILNTNLKAPYFLTQRVARAMIEQIQSGASQEGMIVNISSLRSYTAARNYGEYCISKAGVSMMTKLFAVRLAEHNINVYEICPGIIETDMTSGQATQDYYNAKLESGMTPINRWGRPEEVGRAVSAIALGHFPFSTGAVFHVDGGWHIRHL